MKDLEDLTERSDCMNSEIFTDYVSKYQSMVYRIAFSYVKNSSDAEDIVQNVFLKLYDSKITFESDENVKRWLIRVAINCSKNHLKSFWIKKRDTLDEGVYLATERDFVILDELWQLKPDYRIAIYLYYYEGYGVKEIRN